MAPHDASLVNWNRFEALETVLRDIVMLIVNNR